MFEKAEIEKQINILKIKPQTPEWIVNGHLPPWQSISSNLLSDSFC